MDLRLALSTFFCLCIITSTWSTIIATTGLICPIPLSSSSFSEASRTNVVGSSAATTATVSIVFHWTISFCCRNNSVMSGALPMHWCSTEGFLRATASLVLPFNNNNNKNDMFYGYILTPVTGSTYFMISLLPAGTRSLQLSVAARTFVQSVGGSADSFKWQISRVVHFISQASSPLPILLPGVSVYFCRHLIAGVVNIRRGRNDE